MHAFDICAESEHEKIRFRCDYHRNNVQPKRILGNGKIYTLPVLGWYRRNVPLNRMRIKVGAFQRIWWKKNWWNSSERLDFNLTIDRIKNCDYENVLVTGFFTKRFKFIRENITFSVTKFANANSRTKTFRFAIFKLVSLGNKMLTSEFGIVQPVYCIVAQNPNV